MRRGNTRAVAQKPLCYRGFMPSQETRALAPSSVSARIIAAGIVIAFCYWASAVLMTLLFSVLVAYFLDPLVSWIERLRIPRALSSLLVVLVSLGLLAVLGWSLVERVNQFGRDWPKYRAPLREVAQEVSNRLESLEMHVSEITPVVRPSQRLVTVTESHPVRDALVGKLGSLYVFVMAATFVPFLVFFMLAAKRQLWQATMELFPSDKRDGVKNTLAEVTRVLRGYLMGTALVGLLLVLASWVFFWGLGLDFPFLTGLVSGLCNLVPYLGAVLAWIPPLLIGLKQFHSVGPYVGIFTMLTLFHVVTINLLVPALIGWHVRLNALALTVALLFWGWLWGAMGLILAIPITAVIKVICEHAEGWHPVARWLSA